MSDAEKALRMAGLVAGPDDWGCKGSDSRMHGTLGAERALRIRPGAAEAARRVIDSQAGKE